MEMPDRVHVEHIYPQRPQAGHRWANHDALINRLGNLTLLARRLTEAIRNGDFAAKAPIYNQSDIRITRELTGVHDWNEVEIEARQTRMADAAVAVWSFPAI